MKDSLLASPPQPFEASEWRLAPGDEIHRIHSNSRHPAEANPGYGTPTRFAFFPRRQGGGPVPVMYAAETARAAIAETILHDSVRVPGQLSAIGPTAYLGLTLSRLRVTKVLRLADMTGLAAKRLGLDGTALSAHRDYSATVKWAQAAYQASFDGLTYMSHRCNTDRAFVIFDHPLTTRGTPKLSPIDASVEVVAVNPLDPVLVPSPGFDALVDACTAAGFEVLV